MKEVTTVGAHGNSFTVHAKTNAWNQLRLLNAMPAHRAWMPVFPSINRRVIIKRSVAPMTFDCQVQPMDDSGTALFDYELRTAEEMVEILVEIAEIAELIRGE